MLDLMNVNGWAILVSSVVAFVIGGVWYNPKVFGQSWMDEHGHTLDSLGNPVKAMGLTFITSTITAWVIAVIASGLGVDTLMEGVQLGLLLGVGIMLATRYSDGLYNNQSTKLALIEGGYRAIYTLVVCIIIAVW